MSLDDIRQRYSRHVAALALLLRSSGGPSAGMLPGVPMQAESQLAAEGAKIMEFLQLLMLYRPEVYQALTTIDMLTGEPLGEPPPPEYWSAIFDQLCTSEEQLRIFLANNRMFVDRLGQVSRTRAAVLAAAANTDGSATSSHKTAEQLSACLRAQQVLVLVHALINHSVPTAKQTAIFFVETYPLLAHASVLLPAAERTLVERQQGKLRPAAPLTSTDV